MFTAELHAIGELWKSVFSQGALFLNKFFDSSLTPASNWYLFIFSALLIYSFAELLLNRRRL